MTQPIKDGYYLVLIKEGCTAWFVVDAFSEADDPNAVRSELGEALYQLSRHLSRYSEPPKG